MPVARIYRGDLRRALCSAIFSSTSFFGTDTSRRSRLLNRPYSSDTFGGDNPFVFRFMSALLSRIVSQFDRPHEFSSCYSGTATLGYLPAGTPWCLE